MRPPDNDSGRHPALTQGTPEKLLGGLNMSTPMMAASDGLLSLVRNPDGMVVALAALGTALEAIERPVFMVNRRGKIVHANTVGYRFLEQEPLAIRRSLADMAVAGSASLPWDLTPLQGIEESPGYLAILRSPPPQRAAFAAMGAAAADWNLTARQRQVLDLVALGLTNTDVGGTLGIRECTVEFHLSAIFDKAGVDNRTTLIARMLGI